MVVDVAPKRVKQIDWVISFDNVDSQLLSDRGNDPIVISATIGNYQVHRIFIDNRSAMEVLQWNAFLRMGFSVGDLTLSPLIYGFANQPILVKGTTRS